MSVRQYSTKNKQGGQKIKEAKPVEVEKIEKQEIEKILNKIKIREVVKYLVQFMVEHDLWK